MMPLQRTFIVQQTQLGTGSADMTNDEKYKIIENLNTYWQEAHPDCFLDYPDGRKIFRDDLLDYKQDLLIRNLYGRAPEAQQKLPEFKTPNVRALWLCIGVLMALEVAHLVFHI